MSLSNINMGFPYWYGNVFFQYSPHPFDMVMFLFTITLSISCGMAIFLGVLPCRIIFSNVQSTVTIVLVS
jgi:hypothetical protein